MEQIIEQFLSLATHIQLTLILVATLMILSTLHCVQNIVTTFIKVFDISRIIHGDRKKAKIKTD